MKTTIELPDELFVAAKKRAAELRKPLKTLIEKGLRSELAESRGKRPARGKKRLRWMIVDGGLPPGLDVGDRVEMHEWIRRHR